MSALSFAAAADVAMACIAAVGRDLGPHLHEAWMELATRRPEVGSVTQRDLEHPMAQPIVASPLWAAEAVGGAVDPEVLADIVAASTLGYLHVRVHDDFFDEGFGGPHDVMMLSDALLASASARLAAHVHHPDFWSLYAERLAAYGDAMLLEREALSGLRPYDAATFDAVLKRSGPLIIPGAAVLAVAERWTLVPALDRVLTNATRALQLVNDLTNARSDLANGNRTWVLHQLDVAGDREALARAMVTGFDEIVGQAKALFGHAAAAADELGSPMARRWCEEALQECTRRQERFYAALFHVPPPTAADL